MKEKHFTCLQKIKNGKTIFSISISVYENEILQNLSNEKSFIIQENY